MKLFHQVLDLLLPPRCISCQTIVTMDKTLCEHCWGEANFICAPFCKCCGLPFEFDVPDGALCLDCARQRPPFVEARSVFAYDDFSRRLVLSFKHGDRPDLAPTLAHWMARSAPTMIEQSDVILPVPLHWRRLMARRFNQAALLSKEISTLTQTPWRTDLLHRVRNTTPQGHLSRIARQKNLKNAFSCRKSIHGMRVLLIDDVLTTGATLLNCTNALHKAGALEVRVLTLARVL